MSVSVRDAATVMLVRDGADGVDVFMVRRSLRLVFAGGAPSSGRAAALAESLLHTATARLRLAGALVLFSWHRKEAEG